MKTNEKNTIGWSEILKGVISVAITIIIAVTPFIVNLYGKVERMDEKIKNLEKEIGYLQEEIRGINFTGKVNVTVSSSVLPSKLVDIIKEQQRQYVKASYTENNCFSVENLESFKKEKKQDQIVANLMHENSFIDLIISIKNMLPTDKQALLNECSKTARPTWGELGKISSEGQTDAGKEAETLIANAIVDQVKKTSELSLEKIEKLYDK